MGVVQRKRGDKLQSGFALAIVLWTLAIASLVGLTLAVSVRSEIRVAQSTRSSLEAELLAESGLAFADYISTGRGLGTPSEDLTDIPVTAITSGFHYRVGLPEGTIDIYFEGEGGKINLGTAPRELIDAFFGLWTGDPIRGTEIGAAIEDWRDSGDQQGLGGAEAFTYSGYAPRDGLIMATDPLLIRGLARSDFVGQVIEQQGRITVRPGLNSFITTGQSGPGIDANLAPRLVLLSIPGMSELNADAILAARQNTALRNLEELTRSVGGLGLSAREHLRFGPRGVLVVLSIGETSDAVRYSVRRVTDTALTFDSRAGRAFNRRVSVRLERNVVPEFVTSD